MLAWEHKENTFLLLIKMLMCDFTLNQLPSACARMHTRAEPNTHTPGEKQKRGRTDFFSMRELRPARAGSFLQCVLYNLLFFHIKQILWKLEGLLTITWLELFAPLSLRPSGIKTSHYWSLLLFVKWSYQNKSHHLIDQFRLIISCSVTRRADILSVLL